MEDISKGYLIFKAMDHYTRIKMLDLIELNGSINVTDIYTTLKLRQTICSSHLRILSDVNLINKKRIGRFKYYSLNKELINQIYSFTKAL